MNINEIIFSKTAPQKKLDIIISLSEDELMSTTKATILRIVKEVGSKTPHSRDKSLHVSYERKAGNDWNSIVEGLDYRKGRLYLDIYLQYSNTDTNTYDDYDRFFAPGTYRGEVRRCDERGNPRSYYFDYNRSDKAKVIRSALLEYVYRKYNDKLQMTYGKEDQ